MTCCMQENEVSKSITSPLINVPMVNIPVHTPEPLFSVVKLKMLYINANRRIITGSTLQYLNWLLLPSCNISQGNNNSKADQAPHLVRCPKLNVDGHTAD